LVLVDKPGHTTIKLSTNFFNQQPSRVLLGCSIEEIHGIDYAMQSESLSIRMSNKTLQVVGYPRVSDVRNPSIQFEIKEGKLSIGIPESEEGEDSVSVRAVNLDMVFVETERPAGVSKRVLASQQVHSITKHPALPVLNINLVFDEGKGLVTRSIGDEDTILPLSLLDKREFLSVDLGAGSDTLVVDDKQSVDWYTRSDEGKVDRLNVKPLETALGREMLISLEDASPAGKDLVLKVCDLESDCFRITCKDGIINYRHVHIEQQAHYLRIDYDSSSKNFFITAYQSPPFIPLLSELALVIPASVMQEAGTVYMPQLSGDVSKDWMLMRSGHDLVAFNPATGGSLIFQNASTYSNSNESFFQYTTDIPYARALENPMTTTMPMPTVMPESVQIPPWESLATVQEVKQAMDALEEVAERLKGVAHLDLSQYIKDPEVDHVDMYYKKAPEVDVLSVVIPVMESAVQLHYEERENRETLSLQIQRAEKSEQWINLHCQDRCETQGFQLLYEDSQRLPRCDVANTEVVPGCVDEGDVWEEMTLQGGQLRHLETLDRLERPFSEWTEKTHQDLLEQKFISLDVSAPAPINLDDDPASCFLLDAEGKSRVDVEFLNLGKQGGYLLTCTTGLEDQPYELLFQGESEKTITLMVGASLYYLIRQAAQSTGCEESSAMRFGPSCQNGDTFPWLTIATKDLSHTPSSCQTLRLVDETVNRWIFPMQTLQKFGLHTLDWPLVEAATPYRLGSKHLYITAKLENQQEQAVVLKDYFEGNQVPLTLRLNQMDHQLLPNQTYIDYVPQWSSKPVNFYTLKRMLANKVHIYLNARVSSVLDAGDGAEISDIEVKVSDTAGVELSVEYRGVKRTLVVRVEAHPDRVRWAQAPEEEGNFYVRVNKQLIALSLKEVNLPTVNRQLKEALSGGMEETVEKDAARTSVLPVSTERSVQQRKRREVSELDPHEQLVDKYLDHYEYRVRGKSERSKKEKKALEKSRPAVEADDNPANVTSVHRMGQVSEKKREKMEPVAHVVSRDMRVKPARHADVERIGRNQTESFVVKPVAGRHATKEGHQFFTRQPKRVVQLWNRVTPAQLPWHRHHQSPPLFQGTANFSKVTEQHSGQQHSSSGGNAASKPTPPAVRAPDLNGTLLLLNVLARKSIPQSPRATVSAYKAAIYHKAVRQREEINNRYAGKPHVVKVGP